jgi:hypothetical protein
MHGLAWPCIALYWPPAHAAPSNTLALERESDVNSWFPAPTWRVVQLCWSKRSKQVEQAEHSGWLVVLDCARLCCAVPSSNSPHVPGLRPCFDASTAIHVPAVISPMLCATRRQLHANMLHRARIYQRLGDCLFPDLVLRSY